MKECIILSGGSVSGNEPIPTITKDTTIISADGGYTNALKFGIKPNVAIGDFDTIDTNRIDTTSTTIKYPTHKDDTDTMLCVKQAIELGSERVLIYGALGGRFDHTIANVQALEYLDVHGVTGYLIDDNNVVTMQSISIKQYRRLPNYKYFSILSVSERSEVSANGLEYPLTNTILTRDFPLGVSNSFLKDTTTVIVHDGLVLIVYSKD